MPRDALKPRGDPRPLALGCSSGPGAPRARSAHRPVCPGGCGGRGGATGRCSRQLQGENSERAAKVRRAHAPWAPCSTPPRRPAPGVGRASGEHPARNRAAAATQSRRAAGTRPAGPRSARPIPHAGQRALWRATVLFRKRRLV